MSNLSNRRRFRRVPVNIPVTEDLVLGPATARSVDLSVWGMRYFGPAGGGAGRSKEIRLAFCLPQEARTIHALGLVTDEKADQVFRTTSVRFTQIAPDDLARIRRYVSQQRAA